MSLNPCVEFRALQTKLTLKITFSRLRPYPSMQNYFDSITVARVLFTHQQQFKQQLARRNGSDLQPSAKLRFTKHQQTRTKKDARQRAQQEMKCRTWSCCRWYSTQFVPSYTGAADSKSATSQHVLYVLRLREGISLRTSEASIDRSAHWE